MADISIVAINRPGSWGNCLFVQACWVGRLGTGSGIKSTGDDKGVVAGRQRRKGVVGPPDSGGALATSAISASSLAALRFARRHQLNDFGQLLLGQRLS